MRCNLFQKLFVREFCEGNRKVLIPLTEVYKCVFRGVAKALGEAWDLHKIDTKQPADEVILHLSLSYKHAPSISPNLVEGKTSFFYILARIHTR